MSERLVRDVRAEARRSLAATACLELTAEDAASEADLVLGRVLGCSRAGVLARISDLISASRLAQFQQLLSRRLRGEPMAYIFGEREFYSRLFSVDSAVLIPRPETEQLADLALVAIERLVVKGNRFNVFDIGAGSGALIVTLAAEVSTRHPGLLREVGFCAIDLSQQALAVCGRNADRLLSAVSEAGRLSEHAGHPVALVQGDLLGSLLPPPKGEGAVIVANLPYVPVDDVLAVGVQDFEPELALRSGTDGLDALRRMLEQLEPWWSGEIWAGFELGDEQAEAVCELALRSGAATVEVFRDLSGKRRIVAATGHGLE